MQRRHTIARTRELQLPSGLRKKPLQERSRAAIRRVLEVAEELILEQGAAAMIGSPTLLLERSGISRGSFYAFFETPERVLDELALQCIEDSRSQVRTRFAALELANWTVLVDAIIDHYREQFEIPLVRELWAGQQNLTANIRELDRIWVDELAHSLFEEFTKLAPQFERLTSVQCVIVVETMERLSQCAFRDDPRGDETMMLEARVMLIEYLGTYE